MGFPRMYQCIEESTEYIEESTEYIEESTEYIVIVTEHLKKTKLFCNTMVFHVCRRCGLVTLYKMLVCAQSYSDCHA